MSNTWGTPAYPRVPYPTPSSNLKKPAFVYSSKSARRAPIENPFDKFPQEDFDAWIGGITGALRRALGEEDATNEESRPIPAPSDDRPPSSEKLGENDYSEAESFVDDSFAELKARRSLNKGKARDPREGPGLGPKYGGQDQPIEIVSGSEEEEAEQQKLSDENEEGSEGEDRSEYGTEFDRDEEDLVSFEAGYSEDARHSEWRQKYGHVKQKEATHGEYGSRIERQEDEDDRDQEEAEEVIELLTDSETESIHGHSQEGEGDEYSSDEEHITIIRSSPPEGENQYETADLEEEEDELQPVDNDTSFPPLATRNTGSEHFAVDIPDPWANVEKYAEDYYAAGTVRPDRHGRMDAHHLGINDDDDEQFLSPDVVTPEEEEMGQSGDEREEYGERKRYEDYENEERTQRVQYPETRDKPFDQGGHRVEPAAEEVYPRNVYDTHFQLFSELRSTGEVTSFERHLPPHFASGPDITYVHPARELPKSSPEIIAIDSDDDWDTQEDELADATIPQAPLQGETEQKTTVDEGRTFRVVGDDIGVIGARRHESPAILDFAGLPKDSNLSDSIIPSPPTALKLPNEVHGEKENGLLPSKHSPTPSIQVEDHIGAVETGDDISGLYDSNESERKRQHDVVEHLFDLDFPSTLTHGITTSTDYLRSFGIGTGSIFESPIDARPQRHTVEMEEVVDEDEPGAFPLMTSDLDYERPIEDEVADSDDRDVDTIPEFELESTPKLMSSIALEGYVLPAEVVEAEDDDEDIHIVVEGAEDQPSFSGDTQDIPIAIEPATPAASSRSSTPESSRYFGPDETLGRAAWPSFLEHTTVGANPPTSKLSSLEVLSETQMESASLPEQESPQRGNLLPHAVTPSDKLTEGGPITETHQHDAREEPSGNAEGNTAHKEEETEQVSIVDGPGDGSQEEQQVPIVDKLLYVVSEPLTDSESPELEGPDRRSLGIVSVHSDEVIPEVIRIADNAQAASGSEHVEDIPGRISQCSGGVQNQPPFIHPTDNQLSKPEVGELEFGPRQSADVDNETYESTFMPNDYFAQPGSPVLSDIPMGLGTPNQLNLPSTPSGGRPTIISLPGTPHRVLSPGGTPQPGPTPVSIAVDPSFLKALKTDPHLFSAPAINSDAPIGDPSPAEVAEPARPSSTSLPPIEPQTSDILESDSTTSYPNLGAQSSLIGTSSSSLITVTRNSTDPVLVPDPYPYSLSTPISPPFVQEPPEEGSEDDSASLTSASERDADSKESIQRTSGTFAEGTVLLNGKKPLEPSASSIEESILPVTDLEPSHSSAQEFGVEAEGETDSGFAPIRREGESVNPTFETKETDGRDSSKFMVTESAEAFEKVSDALTEEHGHRDKLPEVPEVVVPTLESVIKGSSNKHPKSDATISEHTNSDEHSEPSSPRVPRVHFEPESEDVLEHVLSRSTHNWLYPTAKSPRPRKSSPQPELPQLEHVKAPVYSHEQVDPVQKDTLQHVPSHSFHPRQRSRSTTPKRRTASAAPELPDLGQVKAPVYSFAKVASDIVADVSANDTAPSLPSLARATTPRSTTLRHKTASPEIPKLEEASAPVYSLCAMTSEKPVRSLSPTEPKLPAEKLKSPQPAVATVGKRKRSLSDVSDKRASPSIPESASGAVAAVQGTKKRARRPKKETSKQISAIRAMDFGTAKSRSPSVASTAMSDNSSSIAQPSPTTDKPHLPSSEPQPFLHAHSRRKKAREPVTVQEQFQKHVHKIPLLSRSQDGSLKAEDILTKAQHAPSHRDTTSPVTRSHCRYHKISIPKSDDGPRIFFLVPGCTLNDETLISEEEIEDHGTAMILPDTRIVQEIETLDLDPYLLWVIRQLVGLDITRENEVFYLPQPGEEIVRKSSKPTKMRSKTRKLAGNVADIAGDSVLNHKQANVSRESSVASSTSVLQRMLLDSDIESLSTVTETEDETKQRPNRPRPRRKGEAIQDGMLGDVSTLVERSETKSLQNGSRKRVRRLGKDAAAYRPTSESSSDESDDGASRRKPSQDRRFKRARASEGNMVGVDNRRVKKPKTHPSKSDEISNSV